MADWVPWIIFKIRAASLHNSCRHGGGAMQSSPYVEGGGGLNYIGTHQHMRCRGIHKVKGMCCGWTQWPKETCGWRRSQSGDTEPDPGCERPIWQLYQLFLYFWHRQLYFKIKAKKIFLSRAAMSIFLHNVHLHLLYLLLFPSNRKSTVGVLDLAQEIW